MRVKYRRVICSSTPSGMSQSTQQAALTATVSPRDPNNQPHQGQQQQTLGASAVEAISGDVLTVEPCSAASPCRLCKLAGWRRLHVMVGGFR